MLLIGGENGIRKVGEVGMTIQRMLELLKIEHECMLRGSHDDCDRNCADCELVQDDGDLHEMYTDIIALLKEQEEQIKQLEHDLAVAQNNLNYYINGND